jgi:hypothetical protein
MIRNHGRQQVLFEAAKHMDARCSIRREDVIQVTFLTTIGVVPDDKICVGFMQSIGQTFSAAHLNSNEPRDVRSDRLCQQGAQARFRKSRSGQNVAMPVDDRFQPRGFVVRPSFPDA